MKIVKGQTAGPISEPRKYAEDQLRKSGPHLLKHWKAVVVIAVGSFVAGYLLRTLLDESALSGKDATIQTKDSMIQSLQTRAENLQKDNEVLQKENTRLQQENRELKTGLAQFTAPLKKRTLILASQLGEFGRTDPTNVINWVGLQSDFGHRFADRLRKTVTELDEDGQHSDILAKLAQTIEYTSPLDLISNAVLASKELEKLANNIKE